MPAEARESPCYLQAQRTGVLAGALQFPVRSWLIFLFFSEV